MSADRSSAIPHARLGADAERAEVARELIRARVQRRERDSLIVGNDGHGVRCSRRLLFEQIDDGARVTESDRAVSFQPAICACSTCDGSGSSDSR
mgnify:CR=1 FL=1